MLTKLLKSLRFPGLGVQYVIGDETLTEEGAAADSKKVGEELAKKVDKVTGKGLSTNDYTSDEKSKLAGIEAGAKANVIESVQVNGVALVPEDKVINIIVVTAEEIQGWLSNKLNLDGYSELATVGTALQLLSNVQIEDKEPYIYRRAGGSKDIGDRAYMELVGGSVVWNQLAHELSDTYWGTSYQSGISGTSTYADGVRTVHLDESTGGVVAINIGANHKKTTIAGHKYLFSATLKTANGQVNILPTGVYAEGSKGWASYPTRTRVDYIWGATEEKALYFTIRGYTGNGVTSAIDFTAENAMCFDLTAALGSTIADYIYTLEQANAGAGVAYFRKYFPEEYYEYCEPHFEHVQTSQKTTVGFNQWDEAWEAGSIDSSTGLPVSGTGVIRSKNFIQILPSTTYYFHCETIASMGSGNRIPVYCYDSDKNYIGRPTPMSANNETFVTPYNCHYIKFRCGGEYGTTYNHDICINLSDPSRNGEYEPYQKRTYPIDPIELRGIPKLDTNGDLYFDGDEYTHDGSGSRRMHVVSSADLTVGAYDATTGQWSLVLPNSAPTHKYTLQTEVLNMSTTYGFIVSSKNNAAAYSFAISASDASNTSSFILKLDTTQVTTVSEALAWVQAHPFDLMYEVATPEPFTAEPFQSPQVVDPLGTEEFIDYGVEQGDRDVAIPVGHVTEYPADLRTKLERLPNIADGDGRYCIQQTSGQMTLVPDTSPGLIAALEARVSALEGGN